MSLLQDYPHLQIIQHISRQKRLKVFLVGGFLRDFFAGTPKIDFDFAVSKEAIALARNFARKIKGAFILLDQDHGCARVAKKSDGRIYTFDFADFRAATFQKDLSLRDFTVNTLSLNVDALKSNDTLESSLLDYKNGLKDIKLKRIKMVSLRAFKDDPLRMLRAFTLQALLGFKMDAKTLAQIKKDKDLIRQVSIERIREELFKILESPRAAANLKAMDKAGLLEKIIPQIHVMYGCLQGGYHHLDVWPHSLETVVQVEKIFEEFKNNTDIQQYLNENFSGEHTRKSTIKLAALLHDIGKPDTRKREAEGRISFHGHEHVGRDIVRSIARMLKVSTRERHALEDIVLWHLRPGYLSNYERPSERMIFRFLRDTKEEAVSVLLMSLADQRSTRGPLTSEKDQAHHEKICLGLVQQYFDKKKEKPLVRLIDGHDLIKALKLKPSPLFGKILSTLEEKQNLGEITTRNQALVLAKEIAQKIKA